MESTLPPCTFYLVRHGETVWNARRIIQGQQDSPLTPTGEEQARRLAAELRDVHFDAVFSSDSGRAVRTAEIIAAGRALEIHTNPLLRERKYGAFEGQPLEAMLAARRILYTLPDAERFRYKSAADVESDEEMVRRLLAFLTEASERHRGETLLVVTHGGMMRAFLIYLGVGTYAGLGGFPVGNCAHVRLEADGERLSVLETRGIAQPA